MSDVTNETAVSAAYLEALEASRVASRAYIAAQAAYRAREIDDAAFLEARAAFTASTAAFDAACALEQSRGDAPATAVANDDAAYASRVAVYTRREMLGMMRAHGFAAAKLSDRQLRAALVQIRRCNLERRRPAFDVSGVER